MTTQEKDRIECAIRHIQTAVDVDPWAVEIAVEAMKTQLSAEGTTSDLISRQEAIEVADAVWCVTGDVNVAKVWDQLKNLPSAQPEIVRCKDCKFYTAYDYTGKLMCKRIGKGMILPKLEDYCSYAERIADERSD